jgi:hypothetical protein
VVVKLAELRDRLLDHPPSDTNVFHEPPVAMDLPVLLANRMRQVHAPSEPTLTTEK